LVRTVEDRWRAIIAFAVFHTIKMAHALLRLIATMISR
jgi:hypothetical protein